MKESWSYMLLEELDGFHNKMINLKSLYLTDHHGVICKLLIKIMPLNQSEPLKCPVVVHFEPKIPDLLGHRSVPFRLVSKIIALGTMPPDML